MDRVKIGDFYYQYSNEDIMPFGGLPLVSELIKLSGLDHAVQSIPYYLTSKREPLIPNKDILRTMIGLLAQGKSDFSDVTMVSRSSFFKDAMSIRRLPSEERLRQRLDLMDDRIIKALDSSSMQLLSICVPTLQPSYKDFIPVDLDVSPMDNSNTKKEGVGCTYKLCDGYAPMFAYLGQEGYMIGCEFRKGTQHSQDGTPAFLEEIIERLKQLEIKQPLVRMDSGNDSTDNIILLQKNHIDFLIKRNPRKQKQAWVEEVIEKGENKGIRIDPQHRKIEVYQQKKKEEINDKEIYIYTEVRKVLEEKNGQLLLIPDYELESYSTSLNEKSVEDIKEIYHQHGICEQFHSELKTDMGVERMPSGKFQTNDTILHIAMMTFNILRMIGQNTLMNFLSPREKAHMIKRKRLSKVIKDIVMIAAKYVRHAREKLIKIGYGNQCLVQIKSFKQLVDNI